MVQGQLLEVEPPPVGGGSSGDGEEPVAGSSLETAWPVARCRCWAQARRSLAAKQSRIQVRQVMAYSSPALSRTDQQASASRHNLERDTDPRRC